MELTERLEIRATPAQKRQWEEAASWAHLNLSAWIRTRLIEAARAEGVELKLGMRE